MSGRERGRAFVRALLVFVIFLGGISSWANSQTPPVVLSNPSVTDSDANPKEEPAETASVNQPTPENRGEPKRGGIGSKTPVLIAMMVGSSLACLLLGVLLGRLWGQASAPRAQAAMKPEPPRAASQPKPNPLSFPSLASSELPPVQAVVNSSEGSAVLGPRLVATLGLYKGQAYPLRGPVVHIGRDSSNGIVLRDNKTSRRHATIQEMDGQYTVTDHESSNGTLVNGVVIPPGTPHPLRIGDELEIGATRFRFDASVRTPTA